MSAAAIVAIFYTSEEQKRIAARSPTWMLQTLARQGNHWWFRLAIGRPNRSIQYLLRNPGGYTSTSQEPQLSTQSPWSPLRIRLFRGLWIATLISNLGTWMHEVGAGWLMTSLSSSPSIVALVSAAGTFPVMLLALPAGAIADILDRRRLLIAAQGYFIVVIGALALLAALGIITPWLLLAFTFAVGVGTALTMPAWSAIVPELVPADELPAAIALNSIGIEHLARDRSGNRGRSGGGGGATARLRAGRVVLPRHSRRPGCAGDGRRARASCPPSASSVPFASACASSPIRVPCKPSSSAARLSSSSPARPGPSSRSWYARSWGAARRPTACC